MAKRTPVITGTKKHKNTPVTVLRGQKDVRQVRCLTKMCGALIAASSDGKGGTRHKCPQCGAVVVSTRL